MRTGPEAPSAGVVWVDADALEVVGGGADVAAAQRAADARRARIAVSGLRWARRARPPAAEAGSRVRKVAPGNLPPLRLVAHAHARLVGHVIAHAVVVLSKHVHLTDARDVDGGESRFVLPLSATDALPLLTDVGHGGGGAAAAREEPRERLERLGVAVGRPALGLAVGGALQRAHLDQRRRGVEICGRVLLAAGDAVDRVGGRARAADDRVELRVRRRSRRGEAALRAELEHAHHLGLGQLVKLLRLRAGASVDHLVEVKLLLRALHDALLHRARRDEPVHVHHFLLSDAMDARHCLHVHLRVPVRVEEDAGVRRLAVDAEAASARRHQEDEPLAAFHVEGVDVDGALYSVGAAVEPAVLVADVVEKVFEEVERRGELREENHAVATGEELGQQAREHLKLSGAIDELLFVRLIGRRLNA
mmetsp:Transcript_54583/g.119033  ORF Transcript_54583/g.119033 Transcript_54583/m.119033 type:complete len:421 (+) Transcript_54583:1335-2597(+)